MAPIIETQSDRDAGPSDEDPEGEWAGFPEADETENVVPDKDEEEEELERLVFGDARGWRDDFDGIKADSGVFRGGMGEVDDDDDAAAQADLSAVDDADLFFVDSGPAQAKGSAQELVRTVDGSDSEDGHGGRGPPAWEDSEDERITVSLASVGRLRKLRKTEDEDVIGGKTYVRRLRRQFERLNGRPEWARWAEENRGRTRSAGTEDEDWTDEDEDGQMDVDSDSEAAGQRVKPLSALWQDANEPRSSSEPPRKKRKLRPEVLDIQRLKDVPGSQPSAITSLSTHPSHPLLLSSGPASTLYLHHVLPANAARPNPLLTSVHIKNTPLTTTAFHPLASDARVFLSARRRYFHVWHLDTGALAKVTRVYGHAHEQRSMEAFKLSPDGRHLALLGSARRGSGVLNVLDARTLQWAAQCRVEGRGGVADFAWWRDGRGLCVLARNGEVTEWSVAEQRTVARWADEGAVGPSALCLGGGGGGDDVLGGDRWVAVGSSSGIVNVYDRRAWTEDAGEAARANGGVPPQPKPTKVLDQLTTTVTHLEISQDGQLLLMASRYKRDALKLVHLPSCTVYRNWPTSSTPLGRVSAVAWGRPDMLGKNAAKEGVVSVLFVGNESGKIRIWEIRG